MVESIVAVVLGLLALATIPVLLLWASPPIKRSPRRAAPVGPTNVREYRPRHVTAPARRRAA